MWTSRAKTYVVLGLLGKKISLVHWHWISSFKAIHIGTRSCDTYSCRMCRLDICSERLKLPILFLSCGLVSGERAVWPEALYPTSKRAISRKRGHFRKCHFARDMCLFLCWSWGKLCQIFSGRGCFFPFPLWIEMMSTWTFSCVCMLLIWQSNFSIVSSLVQLCVTFLLCKPCNISNSGMHSYFYLCVVIIHFTLENFRTRQEEHLQWSWAVALLEISQRNSLLCGQFSFVWCLFRAEKG